MAKAKAKEQPVAKDKNIPRRELYPTGEAKYLLCCSPTFLMEEMDAGRLGYVLRGNRRYIPQFAIDEYVRSLCVKGVAK